MIMRKLYRCMSLMAVLLLMLASVALAQERVVTGTVTDDTGAPLPGANVVLKGTTTGTTTDAEGKYRMSIPGDDAVLVFSFIGYATSEMAVGTRTSLDLAMKSDASTLDEIVVVGYGETKKSLVTGAISSVKAEELKTVSVGSIDQAMQGRSAGVQMTPNSGQPGAGTRIRIRGIGSNGNSNPLFIVDGVRTGTEGIDYLNPNDIASIEVLKDAASTAIYGAEGGNGVVIVTTKSGKVNTSEITYSGQVVQQSYRPSLKLMNPDQYVQYLDEANVVGRPTAGDIVDRTDWIDAGFSNAPLQNHTISFTGGTEKSSLFISGGYYNQKGIVGGDKSKFERYSLRVNSNHKLREWLNIGENFAYTNRNSAGLADNTEFGGVIGSILSLDPLTPVRYTGALPAHAIAAQNAGNTLIKDDNDQYFGISRWISGEYGNPLITYAINHGNTVQNKILGNVYVELQPIKNLKFTSRFGIDAAFQKMHSWNPTWFYSNEQRSTVATGTDNWEQWFGTQWENFANYNRTVGDHNLGITAGIATKTDVYDKLNGSYSDLFQQKDIWSYPDYVIDTGDRIGGTKTTKSLLSYFGRVSYDYKDTYMLNVTVRRDGSSLLATGNQWGTFPSVSLGWVASNESFYQGVEDVMSYFKLRGSWGQNGYLSNIAVGQWQNSISTNIASGTFRGPIRYLNAQAVAIQGGAPTQAENPNLTWETSQQLNIGADMRFLNDKLTLTADYFKKTTKDLISSGSPPFIAGIGIPYTNAGSIENKGIELELAYRAETASGFKYEISANYTNVKNEVTALNSDAQAPTPGVIGTHWTNATRFTVGDPVWSFWGYKTAGVFQNQAQIDQYVQANGLTFTTSDPAPVPGDPIIVNTNGDNSISSSDWVNIGNPHPTFYYGTRVNLSYKGFDFLMFLQGQGGNDILMGFFRTDRGTANKPEFFYTDRWTGENSTNTWFRAAVDGKVYNSDFMVAKGNFAKIRQLQFGYTLPSAINETLRVKSLRVYFALDNYFVFTKYKGFDPEVGNNGFNAVGIDRGTYPSPRRVVGGLTLSF
jgi:TonB-linked SusC/RagA family outer membrane protein